MKVLLLATLDPQPFLAVKIFFLSRFIVKNKSLRKKITAFWFSHLHLHGSSLYLRDALGEDEGDAIVGAAGHLAEVPAEELQAALQLLVAALDGQRLQAALVTRQETLPRGGGCSD